MVYETIKTNKKKNIKIYVEDWYILRNSNSKSIADAIHTLLFGNREDLKEIVEDYMQRVVFPYVQEKMSEIKGKD